jgi:hypothetical protein
MVLRALLLLFISTQAFALSTSELREGVLMNQYELMLDKIEDYEDDNDNPSEEVLKYKAFALEQQQKYYDAIKVYIAILKKHHKSTHLRVKKYFSKKRKGTKPRLSKKLLFYYFKLSELFAKQYATSEYKHSDKRRRVYSYLHRYYKKILASYDAYEDEMEAPAALYDEYETRQKGKVHHRRYTINMGYYAWKDRIHLTNASGKKVDLVSDTSGTSIGASIAWENMHHSLILEGGFISATAKVLTKDASVINYKQEGIAVTAFYLEPAFLFKVSDGGAEIGFGMPILHTSGNYTEPSGVTLSNKQETKFLYQLQTRLLQDKWGLTTKIANHANFENWLLGLDIFYRF